MICINSHQDMLRQLYRQMRHKFFLKWLIIWVILVILGTALGLYLVSCGGRYSLTPVFYDHGCCEVEDGEVVERK